MDDVMGFLSMFVDKGKLGGWVRALVAAGLGALVVDFPGLKDILTPAEQGIIGTAISTLVVGIWSHYAKSVGSNPPPMIRTAK